MSLTAIIFNPLSISILLTIIILFPLPYILGYFLQNNSKYFFELVGLLIFIITSLLSFFISIYASGKHCKRYKIKTSIKKGLLQGLYTMLIYLTIFFIPFFKKPFIELGSNNLLWNSIGEGFFIGMSNIALTIINYFSSQVEGCKLSAEESAKEYKKIEKKLQSRKKKRKPEKITINQ
jgi:hypothetical protein